MAQRGSGLWHSREGKVAIRLSPDSPAPDPDPDIFRLSGLASRGAAIDSRPTRLTLAENSEAAVGLRKSAPPEPSGWVPSAAHIVRVRDPAAHTFIYDICDQMWGGGAFFPGPAANVSRGALSSAVKPGPYITLLGLAPETKASLAAPSRDENFAPREANPNFVSGSPPETKASLAAPLPRRKFRAP